MLNVIPVNQSVRIDGMNSIVTAVLDDELTANTHTNSTMSNQHRVTPSMTYISGFNY